MLKSFAWLCEFFYLTSSAKDTLCAGVEPLFVFLSKKVQLLGLRVTFCLIQRNHARKTTLRPFDTMSTITANHDINCLTIYGNATLLTRKPVVTLSMHCLYFIYACKTLRVYACINNVTMKTMYEGCRVASRVQKLNLAQPLHCLYVAWGPVVGRVPWVSRLK